MREAAFQRLVIAVAHVFEAGLESLLEPRVPGRFPVTPGVVIPREGGGSMRELRGGDGSPGQAVG